LWVIIHLEKRSVRRKRRERGGRKEGKRERQAEGGKATGKNRPESAPRLQQKEKKELICKKKIETGEVKRFVKHRKETGSDERTDRVSRKRTGEKPLNRKVMAVSKGGGMEE